jgi:hypothetical protein
MAADDGEDSPEPARAARPSGAVTREAVEWGFRLLAGRAPLNAGEEAAFLAQKDLDALRRMLANTHDFHAFFGSLLTGAETWAVPMFMLRPPANKAIPWRFEPPDLENPCCQLCTAGQFNDAAYLEIAQAMGYPPGVRRMRWDPVWIVSVLATAELIAPGRRGLALLAGSDRVAALVASRGVEVLATAPPRPDNPATETRRTALFHPEVVHIEDFDRLVRFADLDPRHVGSVPRDAFDFCWSMGAPHRLGSIAAALDFFEASLVPLKPGGIAAHAFDFNLTSNRSTWEQPGNVLLRRRDVEALAERLAASGHEMLPINTHPGLEPADERVRGTIGSSPGLRQRSGMMVSTSFGIAIRKGG